MGAKSYRGSVLGRDPSSIQVSWKSISFLCNPAYKPTNRHRWKHNLHGRESKYIYICLHWQKPASDFESFCPTTKKDLNSNIIRSSRKKVDCTPTLAQSPAPRLVSSKMCLTVGNAMLLTRLICDAERQMKPNNLVLTQSHGVAQTP